jgi:hypothetical protein
MATSAQYVATPKVGSATLSTTTQASADTALANNSAGMVLLFTAGANGARIDQINLVAGGGGASSAGMIRLFYCPNTTAGTTTVKLKEFVVTAVTPSTTQTSWNTAISTKLNPEFLPLILPANSALYVGTAVSQTNGIVVCAEGGDF